MKTQKIIYWIATVLLCLLMLYSAGMYLSKTEVMQSIYEQLGYPSYLVLPMAFAKLLAITMILWRKSAWLTEWAYAGLFFDMVLAFFAHYMVKDGGTLFPLLGLIFLLVSYFFGKVVRD